MSEIRARSITPDDWEDWRDIRLRSLLEDPDAFGSTYARESQFDESTWRARTDGISGPAMLAYADDKAVGMGAGWLYEPGRLMVVAMWTEPAWRGQGVGRSLLDQVVGWARERALRPDLWVADANLAARRLYERYGFEPNGETAPLREESGLTMTRLVLPC